MANKTDKKVWFITGSSSGMGASTVKAALNAGHAVVATDLKPETVSAAFGEQEDLLILKLDITKPKDSEAAVNAAVQRFGKIDVLFNNAGVFFAGFFENTSMAQIREQLEIDTYGTLNVTRAVLPVMRKQRSGLVITTTSAGALLTLEFCGVYSTSKFALEGWMEGLRYDLAPFGIKTMIAEPGFMRTAILGPKEIKWPDLSIDDYNERTKKTIEEWKVMDGTQPGSPDKFAECLIKASEMENPPFRFIAGEDAIQMAETKVKWLMDDIHTCRELLMCSKMSYND